MNTLNNPPRYRGRGARRSKRGSVLILVVALLVLMALIGTAWVSTARVDRAATIQTVNSTQADLFLQGVENMAKSAIVADASDANTVRRGDAYSNTDGTASDPYLASRIPVFIDEFAPAWNPAPSTTPLNFTPYADAPVYEEGQLVRRGGGTTGRYYVCIKTHRAEPSKSPSNANYWLDLGPYNLTAHNGTDNPVFWAATSSVQPPGVKFEDPVGQYGGYTQRRGVRLISKQLPNGQEHPGFEVYIPGVGPVQVLAADTDGDGAADASYFKLPVGKVDGLDWYAAVRIVDNNSAVNPSVARGNFPGEPASASDILFPSSVNLYNTKLLIGKTAPNTDPKDQFRFIERWRANDGKPLIPPNAINYNTTPINDQFVAPFNRKDFVYSSIPQLHWMVAGRRSANPGRWTDGSSKTFQMRVLPVSEAAALTYRGGTLINADAMNPQSMGYTASSIIEQLLEPTLYTSVANHPDVSGSAMNGAYKVDVGRRSSYPEDNQFSWQEWFAHNFDWGPLTAIAASGARRLTPPPENVAEPNTYRNRRVFYAASNPTSSAVPSKLKPRKFGETADEPGAWTSGINYDIGDYVKVGDLTFVALGPVPRGTPTPPGNVPVTGTPYDHPSNVVSWETRPFDKVPTKASVNSGSFGQLFLAFWQTMAQPATLKMPDNPAAVNWPQTQTPFKDDYRFLKDRDKNISPLLESPYFGGRFVAATFKPWSTDPAKTYPSNKTVPGTGSPDQHPLRMFRSPVRTQPVKGTEDFYERTPRLMTDHTMRLRAALAAVNAMDMRDSDDDITVREINLGLNLARTPDPQNSELNDEVAIGRVRVYGHERQPFITEVFAHTDNVSPGPGGAGPNAMGYVAVKFYNPYPIPIDIRNCKLATIDRTRGVVRNLTVADPTIEVTKELAPMLSRAKSNLATANYSDPWVVPAGGVLVLENYDAGSEEPAKRPQVPANGQVMAAANYRPASTKMPAIGKLTADASHNYAYVPNLEKVFDREMVLMRPLFAQATTIRVGGADVQGLLYTEAPGVLPAVSTPAVDMAPLDSYDFTGLPSADSHINDQILPDGGTKASEKRLPASRAQAWHYARAYQPNTDPNATKAWRFVYPGRYDGYQTINDPLLPHPRQQGTQEAMWDPAGGGVASKDPWDVTQAGTDVGISLAPTVIPPANSTYFPYEYAIQLTNTPAVTTNTPELNGAAGPNPVVKGIGNIYPFGGFARNGDILQIPYIGAYRIKITHYPLINKAPPFVSGTTSQVVPPSDTALPYHQVLELNSITMDSVFAEDTNPDNHFNQYTTPQTQAQNYWVNPPEQIGRFTPTVRDMEVSAAGSITGATWTPASPPAPPVAKPGTFTDPERTEGSALGGFDIVIVDGKGKGQVRPITGVAGGGGTYNVYPDWEVQLDTTPGSPTQSKYILRRGSRWGFYDTTVTPPKARTSGNKYWASNLFDYLTVDCPQDQYLPAADPATYARYNLFPAMLPPQAISPRDPNVPPPMSYARMTGGNGKSFTGTNNLIENAAGKASYYRDCYVEFVTGPAVGQVRKIDTYTTSGGGRNITVLVKFDPAPNTNDIFRIIGPAADLVGTQGLININTAPWQVLATIPFDGTGANPTANETIAKAIVEYRDGNPAAGIAPAGPFHSIFDLYKVPLFFDYQMSLIGADASNPVPFSGTDPGPNEGDLTPGWANATLRDQVRYDFEEQYLLLNRISNMITTRSDSFTVYVLVQGWRGAGTSSPELVVQRRRAFIADRSGITQSDKELAVQPVYND